MALKSQKKKKKKKDSWKFPIGLRIWHCPCFVPALARVSAVAQIGSLAAMHAAGMAKKKKKILLMEGMRFLVIRNHGSCSSV